MPEPDLNPELLSSLGRLVRGLSALFWGLPIALVVSVQTFVGRGEWLKPLGFAPEILVVSFGKDGLVSKVTRVMESVGGGRRGRR